MKSFCPFFVGCKSKDVKSKGDQCNNGNASHLFFDNDNESKSEDDVSSGGKDDFDKEGENNAGRKGEDDTSKV